MSATRAERRSRRWVLLVVGSLTGIPPVAIDLYLPGLPELTSDLGAPASTGQLTLTAFLIGLALSQLVAGSLSDRLGRRGPVIVGLVAYVVVSALCALAPDVWSLIALRLAQGATAGVGVVIARAIVRDLYGGAAAARVFALLMLISGVAPVLAPLAGAQVLRFTSWRGVFVVLAASGVVLLVAALLRLWETLPPGLRHEPGVSAKLRTFRDLLADRRFVPYAVSGGLAFAAMFAYIAGSPFVLENVYDLSPRTFSVVFAANAVGIVALAQLSGRLVGRLGPERLLRAGVSASAAGGVGLLAAILLDAGLAAVLASLTLTVSAIGLVVPNATALALAHQPHAAGSASALFGLSQFGLGGLVAPLVGVDGAHAALPMGIVIAACGVGALAVDLLFAPSRQRSSPPARRPAAGWRR